MARCVSVAGFERLNHQLEEFLIGLFQLQVRLLELPQPEYRNEECGSGNRTKLGVRPGEDKNERAGEDIRSDHLSMVVDENRANRPSAADRNCSVDKNRVRKEGQ